MFNISGDFVVCSWLVSPSLFFTFGIYMPIFLVQLAYATNKFGDFNDPLAVLIIQFSVITAIGGVIGFFIAHTRELRRFFLLRTSEKK